MTDKHGALVIEEVCRSLAEGGSAEAADIVRRDYPFAPAPATARRFRPEVYTKVFVRDGFIDRYSGARLVFPPVLRVLSVALPECFPYHPNWKTDRTHPAYWELSATLDHLVPVTRGGADEESNWFTTSMRRNAAKSNSTLEELGWKQHLPGDMSSWDGMLRWFVDYTAAHPEALVDNAVRQWRRTGAAALSALGSIAGTGGGACRTGA